MRRDDFIQPFSYFSILAMLGVKAVVVIVFVFTFLAAGLKNLQISTAYNLEQVPPLDTTASTQISTQPLPDASFGLREMVVPTEIPTQTALPTSTEIPTTAFTATEKPTTTPEATNTSMPTSTATMQATNTTTATVAATSTFLPTMTPTPVVQTPLASNGLFMVASPLQGIPVSELSSIITQPFVMPPAGEDSGHHGVDFAFWRHGDLTSIEGLPILSIFPGKVVSAYNKSLPPYGYLVIVETPMANLPQEVIDAIKLPEASTNDSRESEQPVDLPDRFCRLVEL